VLKGLREIAAIESNESSNRLEGVIVPSKRLKALITENTMPRDRSEQEVAGYRDALALSGRHFRCAVLFARKFSRIFGSALPGFLRLFIAAD
jgi:hypothetical protein